MLNRMVRGGMLAALLLGLAIAVPLSAATIYTDSDGRFSFTVPDGYTPVQTQLTPPYVAGFIAPNTANANFTIQVRDATGSLDATTAEQQKRFTTAAGSEPGTGGIQSLTLGGKPAEQFDYFTNVQGSRFHVQIVICINGSALYLLTFTAQEQDYDALIGQTRGILSSFTFLAAGTNSTSATVSDGTAAYRDPQGRFAFIVPIDFQRSTDTRFRDFPAAFETQFSRNYAAFLVDVHDAGASATMNAFASAIRDYLIEGDYTIIAEQGITLGNQPGYRFDATDTLESGLRARAVVILGKSETALYDIIFICEEASYPVFAPRLQALIASFTFSSTPNAVTPPAAPAPSPAPPKPPSGPVTPPNNPPAASPAIPPPTDHDGR